MSSFFEYLDYVTSTDFVRVFVQGYATVMDFMLTTVNIFGTEYSLLSIILSGGVAAYLLFTVTKYFLPFV